MTQDETAGEGIKKGLEPSRGVSGRLTGQVSRSLAGELSQGRGRAALTFAGQGLSCLPVLAGIMRDCAPVRPWVEAAAAAITGLVEGERPFRWSGLYPRGFDLMGWLKAPETRPDEATLTSSVISQPLIFITQIARYLALYHEGLRGAFEAGAIVALTGHSQGMMPALLVAESPKGAIDINRFVEYVRYFTWQGLHMAQSFQGLGQALGTEGGAPMASVAGLDIGRLRRAVDGINARLPQDQQVYIALLNTRTRHVLSGAPESLAALRRGLDAQVERERKARREGLLGGSPLDFTWEDLSVGAAFHSPAMERGLEAMRRTVAEMGFRVDAAALQLDVISPATAERLNDSPDLTDELVVSQFVRPVRWLDTVRALERRPGLEFIFDLGPGDGVARLTRSALRGSPLRVLALEDPRDRVALFTEGAPRPVRPVVWSDFAPRLVRLPVQGDAPGGEARLFVDNRFTRATGKPPVILPGMTPTTSEVDIVAAAANAGFMAELAGGGQVTAEILDRRLEELGQKLDPGREVVFNALYLDPWLWNLHLGRSRLVQKARRAGLPVCGVTISAGIPDAAEAAALLDDLSAEGLHLNAFKPGTRDQVERVVRIARLARRHTIFVHLEGGKAGGHHSWEDLDQLLLDTYALVRAEPNLVLCVGGGIATEARAVELLTGRWSLAHGERPMPVDAVFIGTLAMACLEATASPQVKRALVEAAGTPAWVLNGQSGGGITSGRSQLNADIHYIDNAAARCGRLLDAIAGDAEAIEARRDEIVAALNATARPYFGPVEEMTWLQVVERLFELTAIGRSGPYEDGLWPDASWRGRALDLLRRAEARLCPRDEGEVESILSGPEDLDDPAEALRRFAAAYPEAATAPLTPSDVRYFVREVCARPGKPVNFVPVIDADVRRWYKADGLWQAQDPRFEASQVLVIPGPEAVAGITRADEPVADLLGRFERALIDDLRASGLPPVEAERLRAPIGPTPLPVGIHSDDGPWLTTLRAIDPPSADAWHKPVSARFPGPVAALFGVPRVFVGARSMPNPILRLCQATPGATLQIQMQMSGEVAEITCNPRRGREAVRVSQVAPDAVRIEVRVPGVEPERVDTWALDLQYALVTGDDVFRCSEVAWREALQSFYGRALFGERGVAACALFETAEAEVVADPARASAYAAVTGGRAGAEGLPAQMAFSLAWEPLFAVIAGDELAGGLLELVHQRHAITPLEGWPPRAGERLQVEARAVRVEDGERGRSIDAVATIRRGEVVVARLDEGFFIRGPHDRTAWAVRRQDRLARDLRVDDQAARDFLLRARGWLQWSAPIEVGDALRVESSVVERRPRAGAARFQAQGVVLRGGEVVGRIALEEGEGAAHPLEVMLAALAAPGAAAASTPRRTLATGVATTPDSMDTFAEISLDLNPIHRSVLMARLAGLGAPIVHGMWSAARLHAFVVEGVAQGQAGRIGEVEATFLAPAPLGAKMSMEAVRVGMEAGRSRVEATASVEIEGVRRPVVRLMLTLEAPRTAYVFPGQGIQQPGMGMAGYGRSRGARQVWDRADAFTRRSLGFSILRIVRDNPAEVLVNGRSWRHPSGVLHLTQFTQVAMAVLAQAQVAELEEAGAQIEGAITCGHSVGEYNALSAVTRVLPLEDVVDIVYHRGLVMHRLVPRDEAGESGYRMGVIRPHYARLSHAEAEALVARVRAEAGFVQIVNYNVRGRQYSVTGRVEALAALEAALAARTPAGGKPAWIEVPGIDVPFHSEVLRGGVDSFRATLQARFPARIEPGRLVGRYIPNLVPRPFSLERDFIEAVVEATGTPILVEILADFEAWRARPEALTRCLLIELLAWQFTSPVRWIETQEILLSGEQRVEQLIEIGVGYQPTLANMARYTQELLGEAEARVLNIEADAEVVFCRDQDPAPIEAPSPAAQAPSPAASVAAAPEVPVAPEAKVSAAGPVADRPVSVAEGLRFILAVQARVRPEQIRADETIDELFEGVSSRRNQVLLDLGAEFNLGTIDGAHEKPIKDLVEEIERRASAWRSPGPYLKGVQDEAIKRLFGRAGVGRKDISALAESQYGLGPGLIEALNNTLALEGREGDASRGGALGSLADARPASKADAMEVIDRAVASLAASTGLPLGRRAAAQGGGGVVDAAAVQALEARLLGPSGRLSRAARELLGDEPEADASGMTEALEAVESRLAGMEAEHGAEYEALVEARFDARKAVAFTSAWASAQRDVARLCFEVQGGRLELADAGDQIARLSGFSGDERVSLTAAWYARLAEARGHAALAAALEGIAGGARAARSAFTPTRPSLTFDAEGRPVYEEVPIEGAAAVDFVKGLWPAGQPARVEAGPGGAWGEALRRLAGELAEGPLDFSGQTALITGAGPGSIALEIAGNLLAGGARVIVTTSSSDRARMAFYREFHQAHAAPGAELYVVPFNQASFRDIDALVDWLHEAQTEQAGASVRVLKRPFAPDLLIPFAAIKDVGTLDALEARSQVAVRAMLLGVERLVARVAQRAARDGVPALPCHVLLPLSPNHGGFGGDGAYSETKLGLEVLGNRWKSEREAWGRAVTLCQARIGWVRGTGLMDANNLVAAGLESLTGVKTFSSREMGLLLTALCAREAREAALSAPLSADLTGGFAALDDIKSVVDGIRAEIEAKASAARRLHELIQRERAGLGRDARRPTVKALPAWPGSLVEVSPGAPRELTPSAPMVSEEAPSALARSGSAPEGAAAGPRVDLSQVVAIVGAGEVGPCGGSRTRFEMEVDGALSAAGVLELAWVTGLVRYDESAGGWVDVEGGELVEESEIAGRYREAVQGRVGIRFVDPATTGFDPQSVPIYTTVYLERDFSFQVATAQEARDFVQADPARTRASYDAEADAWRVTRKAGTEVKVPRQMRLSRRVAGQVPTGFDFTRYGIPRDMVENVDRVTLFNLVATVEAFVSAGMSPEELLTWVHPARVANTQGSGIGGMRSLRRLYTDYLLGEGRQSDVLQETLINVVAAYAVAAYVGSYGPMSHPVAACATAAVSLEEGADKILAGKADFVITGGFDDIEREGALGFSDMSATADTELMLSMGLSPDQMSRSNDARRRGFVEAQGGGTVLLARGDVALRMGLPVLGVVAWAGTFGDGIHKSIPAPGMGALAAAMGGARSPLGAALGRFGLKADDVAMVTKHDTSTAANDPNEGALHDRIQEALGRTPGNPLWVVSQKTLTGHPKGGAAAWQLIGMCQAMASGTIPGNRNLDAVDEAMRGQRHLGFTDAPLRPGPALPIKAGLLTSLGFGHVSAIALILHPGCFEAQLTEAQRQDWAPRARARLARQRQLQADILAGRKAAFEKRAHRRFEAQDGTEAQAEQEAALLLDPEARLDLAWGLFTRGAR